MFNTAFTLSLTQFARTLSFPERIRHRAGRNGLLEAWRMRATSLDALYYDIKSLTSDEIYYVSDAIAAEGLIMIVPPSGGDMLTICDNIEEYVLRGGRNVHTLAVAGIGGSAIGAAAFARNVADAVGEPVAAVVSGYGIGDIMHEAMGGSLFFGWVGNLRNEYETIDEAVGRPHLGAYDTRYAAHKKDKHTCLDIDTLASLLADARLDFKLLTAHSKGSVSLSQALQALEVEEPERAAAITKTRIITFGVATPMPAEFPSVTDVIGDLDWYGKINSRSDNADIRHIAMAGHSTNTDLPTSLHVTDILKEYLAAKASGSTTTSDLAETDIETTVRKPASAANANSAPAPAAEIEAKPEIEPQPELKAEPEMEAQPEIAAEAEADMGASAEDAKTEENVKPTKAAPAKSTASPSVRSSPRRKARTAKSNKAQRRS